MNKEKNISGNGELITSLASHISQPGSAEDRGASIKEEQSSPWSWYKMIFYAFIFLMPLFFLPFTLSPVAMNKKIFAGVVLLGLFIYALAKLLATGKAILPAKGTLIAAASLFLAVLASSALSIGRGISFQGLGADSFFWVSMYLLVFLLSLAFLRNRATIIIASCAFAASAAVLGLFSLFQFSGVSMFPFDFAQSTSFSPVGNVFATAFVMAAALVASLGYLSLAKPKNKLFNAFLWSVVGIAALLLLQMTSLSSLWISLAAGAVVAASVAGMFAMRQNKEGEVNFKPILAPFFVIIISVLALLIQPNISGFVSVPAEVSPTFSETLNITKGALSGPRAIYGTGPGTFPYSFAQHRSIEINETNLWGVQFNQGNSAFLTYVSNWGILGGSALLLMLVTLVAVMARGIMRAKDDGDKTLLGIALGSLSAVSLLGTALFIYRGNIVMHLLLFLGAGIGFSALSALGAKTRKEFDSTRSPQLMLMSSLGAIVLISAAITGIYFAGQQYVGRLYLAKGVETFQENGDTAAALSYFEKSVAANSSDDVILRTVVQALTFRLQEIAGNQDLDPQTANTMFENTFLTARSFAERATRVNPNNVQNWVQLAQVYEQVIGLAENAETRALEVYQKAAEYDPKNPSLPLAEARVHVLAADVLQTRLGQLAQSQESNVTQEKELTQAREGHLNSAIEKLNDSLELKQNYSEARFLMAQTYNRLGELDKAIEETLRVASLNPRDPNIAFQLGLLYYQGEEYDFAKTALESALTLADGSFANARYYLGMAYFNMGERDLAIKEFEQIERNNPDNELVKSVLDNLRNGRDPLEEVSEPRTEAPVSENTETEEDVLQAN